MCCKLNILLGLPPDHCGCGRSMPGQREKLCTMGEGTCANIGVRRRALGIGLSGFTGCFSVCLGAAGGIVPPRFARRDGRGGRRYMAVATCSFLFAMVLDARRDVGATGELTVVAVTAFVSRRATGTRSVNRLWPHVTSDPERWPLVSQVDRLYWRIACAFRPCGFSRELPVYFLRRRPGNSAPVQATTLRQRHKPRRR